MTSVAQFDHRSPWNGVSAVVLGAGEPGFAAADALLHLGADVTILDRSQESASDDLTLLGILGADLRFGADATDPELPDLVVVTDATDATDGWIAGVLSHGIAVWSELDLAWRFREHDDWLVVAGDDEAEQAAGLAAAMLAGDGRRVALTGRGSRPTTQAVMDPEGSDVIVAVVDDDQWRWSTSISAHAVAVLSAGPRPQLRARAYERVRAAALYDDAPTRQMVEAADVVEGARAIGITTGIPAPGELGVVEGILADRAFVADRAVAAAELGGLDDVGLITLKVALTAAGLARALDVSAAAVRKALRDQQNL